MASSTQTTPPTTRSLDATLVRFFQREAPVEPGDTVLVAFSGGPDSTALLAGLLGVAPRLGIRIVAAHLDHGLDPGSAKRAGAAQELAQRLGVTCRTEARSIPELRRSRESLEAAARRVRYRFLRQVAHQEGARWVATAHHRDDQVETVLLRILFGSGWEGLSGIQPVWNPGGTAGPCRPSPAIVRPLLDLPREALTRELRADTLPWLEDPSNRDLARPRNLVRLQLLPRLEARWPGLGDRLVRLAERARRARSRVTVRLVRELDLEPEAGAILASMSWLALRKLPPELLPVALSALHRAAGAPHPAGRRAVRELARQVTAGSDARPPEGRAVHAGVDCGGGFRWERMEDRLTLTRPEPEPSTARFTYTLETPGELIVEDLGIGVRLFQSPVAPWMWRGSPTRAALDLPLAEGDRVEIRNRRPGDRIRPLGSPGSRRLKDLLIDRQVPRGRRQRLPLLVVGGNIAWVPGVTIDHRYRLRGDDDLGSEPAPTVWVAEIFQP